MNIKHLNDIFRHMALVIILTKAGLDLDPKVLKQHWITVLTLGLLPWFLEALFTALLSHLFLELPWKYGFLLGELKQIQNL